MPQSCGHGAQNRRARESPNSVGMHATEDEGQLSTSCLVLPLVAPGFSQLCAHPLATREPDICCAAWRKFAGPVTVSTDGSINMYWFVHCSTWHGLISYLPYVLPFMSLYDHMVLHQIIPYHITLHDLPREGLTMSSPARRRWSACCCSSRLTVPHSAPLQVPQWHGLFGGMFNVCPNVSVLFAHVSAFWWPESDYHRKYYVKNVVEAIC